MTTNTAPPDSATTPRRVWLALFTMMLGSFSLVTSEFLPPGVLTQVATDLRVSEGTVGLTVSITALSALLAATTMSALFPRMDRRKLLTLLTIGAVASNLLVAIAPHIVLLMLARLLVGLAVGGYWSMALVIAARLVPADRVAKAMTVVNAGVTLATVAGVPLGVLLSAWSGWREAFAVLAAVTVLVAVSVRWALPPIPPKRGVGFATMGHVLRSPGVALGLLSVVAIVGAHFAGYTFIRPALSLMPASTPATVALLLALFGIGGVVGNLVLGAALDRHLPLLVLGIPAAIGVGIAVVAVAVDVPALVYIAVVVWGVSFAGTVTAAQVWLTRVVPEEIEAGSGLLTAGFQVAILLGSAVGGLSVDFVGVHPTFLVAAVIAVTGGVMLRTSLTRAAAPA